jgi:Flp pilus assembly pilin Flp
MKRFIDDEAGAVTVDWVVLCAALVAFVVFATNLVGTNAVTSVNASSTAMQSPPTFGQ